MSNPTTNNVRIVKRYEAKVLFEASIDTCGSNYLVIYGEHINGYFCCIPNWNVSCEMAEPTDVFYNRERLLNTDAGIGMNAADALAKAIRDTHKVKNLNLQFRDCCPCIEHGVECPYPEIIDCELCCYGQGIDD